LDNFLKGLRTTGSIEQAPSIVDVRAKANNDTFITSLATLSVSNIQVDACPVLYIISGFGSAKIIKIG